MKATWTPIWPPCKNLIIDDLEIADPESGSRNWTEVRQFNLMFSTQLGNIAGEDGNSTSAPKRRKASSSTS
jgi:glycyl-tRNA synthetase (class II)